MLVCLLLLFSWISNSEQGNLSTFIHIYVMVVSIGSRMEDLTRTEDLTY